MINDEIIDNLSENPSLEEIKAANINVARNFLDANKIDLIEYCRQIEEIEKTGTVRTIYFKPE